MSTSFLLQNVRLSVVQLPLTSLQCTFSFRRYCIFYLYVMRTDVLIRGQSFIFANYCFASSFLQIIKWFTWHSVSALLKQVILKKRKMLFFGSLHKNCFYLHLPAQFLVVLQYPPIFMYFSTFFSLRGEAPCYVLLLIQISTCMFFALLGNKIRINLFL